MFTFDRALPSDYLTIDIPIAPKYRKHPQSTRDARYRLYAQPFARVANLHRALPGAWIKRGAKPNQPPNKEQVSTWSS